MVFPIYLADGTLYRFGLIRPPVISILLLECLSYNQQLGCNCVALNRVPKLKVSSNVECLLSLCSSELKVSSELLDRAHRLLIKCGISYNLPILQT